MPGPLLSRRVWALPAVHTPGLGALAVPQQSRADGWMTACSPTDPMNFLAMILINTSTRMDHMEVGELGVRLADLWGSVRRHQLLWPHWMSRGGLWQVLVHGSAFQTVKMKVVPAIFSTQKISSVDGPIITHPLQQVLGSANALLRTAGLLTILEHHIIFQQSSSSLLCCGTIKAKSTNCCCQTVRHRQLVISTWHRTGLNKLSMPRLEPWIKCIHIPSAKRHGSSCSMRLPQATSGLIILRLKAIEHLKGITRLNMVVSRQNTNDRSWPLHLHTRGVA